LKRKIIITGSICVFLLVSGICYSCTYQKEQSKLNAEDAVDLEDQESEDENQEGLILSETRAVEDNQRSPTTVPDPVDETRVIYVHVCGAVNHPGVYAVKDSARVVDALEVAGGLTKDAAGDYLNQAKPITDGQRIYVPTESELNNLTADEFVSGQEAAMGERQETSSININTADAAQLMTLPGIGQSKANSIIEYRNTNGTFKVIDDLMKVPGIKEGSFEQISDKISVN
jgi:competence protein ComEA